MDAVPGVRATPDLPSDATAHEAAIRTFLIADIRGYSTFTRERGDQAAARLAMRFADLARDATEARGGRVIELRGDEALGVFDRPDQAVRAGIEFQEACREATDDDPDLPLPVGVGIDAGEAIPVEDGYRGKALNMAARLCSKAVAGQVLVTRGVVDSAGHLADVAFQAMGAVELKGFDRPVEILEARSTRDAIRVTLRPTTSTAALPPELDDLTPLADREHEIRWLRGTWRQARRGCGRVLFLSGPAGIGKTRLAGELARVVSKEGGVWYAGPGGASTGEAVAAVAAARSADVPTLYILDGLDLHGGAIAALADSVEGIESRPALVLGVLRDGEGDRELSQLVDRVDVRGDGHRQLGPLGLDGINEIARSYVADVDEVPVESMLRASGGVPERVHELVSGWARDEAKRRLAAAAEWLAVGKRKQAAGVDFANNIIALKLGRIYRPPDRHGVADECPYKGLAPFQEADAAYFYGRERLVGELAARTVGMGMLGVVGPSGSGKSSLVMAGLLPSLAAGLLPGSERWRHATLRPGEHPGDALEAAIQSVEPGERLVVVVDQFEEIFTTTPDELARAAFIARLVELARDPEQSVVVVTIRADYTGHCASYPELSELLASNLVLIGPMATDDLRRAVELPARRVGVRVESALVDALVSEVVEEPGGLPLLSTALVELWIARDDGWLRMESYERTGGVQGAVARLAEMSFGHLEGDQHEAARAVLLRLVGQGEGEAAVRRRVPVLEFDQTPAVQAVLARFIRDRLLTASDGTVEVAHEALIREWPRLRAWLEEDGQGRQIRAHITQAATQWEERDQDQAELYRGARLSVTLDWAGRHGRELNDREREFLSKSREASAQEAEKQRRTNRRLRGLLIGTAIFLIVALLAGSLALVQRSHARSSEARAEREATTSLANSLGAQGLIQPRLDRALLLAREAVNLHVSSQTKSNLLGTVLRSPRFVRELYFGDTGDRPQSVQLSPDGKTLAIPFNSDFVEIFDASTLQPKATLDLAGAPLEFAHRAPLAAGVAKGIRGDIQLIDTSAWGKGRLLAFDPKYEPYPVSGGGMSFSPDDRTLLLTFSAQMPSGGSDSVVDRYDVATGQLRSRMLVEHQPQMASRSSADGTRLVVVDRDATFVYDARTLRQLHRWAVPGSLSAALTADGGTLALGRFDGSILLMDLSTGARTQAAGGHKALVVGMAFSPDGSQLVTGGNDGLVVVWDLTQSPPTVSTTLSGHGGAVHGVATDANTVFTSSLDGTVFVWDLSGRRSFGHQFTAGTGDELSPELSGLPQPNFGLSPDGRLLAAPQSDGMIVVWDLSRFPYRRVRAVSAIASGAVTWTSFSPDGSTLMATGEHGEVTLIDAATGSIGHSLNGLSGTVQGATFNPDGSMVAAADTTCLGPGTCAVHLATWAAASGVPSGPQMTFDLGPGFPGYAGPPVFSPDGRVVAVPVGNGSTRFVDISSRKELRTLSDVDVAAYSPDGRLLATTGLNGLAQLWDPRTWKKIGPSFQDSAGFGLSLSFDPTGQLLVTGATDGTVRLFDVSNPNGVVPFGPPSFPTRVDAGWLAPQFTRDGSAIVVMDVSGQAWVWPMRWQSWAAHACDSAGRQLTRAEWSEFVPGRDYAKVCPT